MRERFVNSRSRIKDEPTGARAFNRNQKENCIRAVIVLERGVFCRCHFVARKPDLRAPANKTAVISVAECISLRDYDSTRTGSALRKLLTLMQTDGLRDKPSHYRSDVRAGRIHPCIDPAVPM